MSVPPVLDACSSVPPLLTGMPCWAQCSRIRRGGAPQSFKEETTGLVGIWKERRVSHVEMLYCMWVPIWEMVVTMGYTAGSTGVEGGGRLGPSAGASAVNREILAGLHLKCC